jgi:mono/diheme cytochrome c family protein
MPHRYLLPVLAVLLIDTASRAVDPTDLKPGLVTVYHGTSGESVTRLEPTVALTLGKGETPHPKLAALASVTWSGYVNVTRPGKYTFSANLSGGNLRVRVGGKVVLDGDAAILDGNSVQLDGGVQPYEATLTATGNNCRVELFWQGPGFNREPMPHQFLGHLPKERPAAFAKDLELEHGRFKFEEFACIKCHRPAADDRLAKTLAERAGPNLTEVAKRAYPGWIDAWLADPAKLRPQTTMPKLFTEDERGRAERYAITHYLVALGGGALAPYRMPFNPPDNVRQSFERGRVLYTVAGCAACHQETRPKPKNEEDDREPLKPEDYIHGLGTASGPSPKYLLGAVGSKTRPEPLAAFLQNPLKTNPAGRMPQMNLGPQEAADIARYLCRLTDDGVNTAMPAAPITKPAELVKDVYKAYFGVKARDELAGFEKLPADKQWADLGGKLVVLKGCVDCHAIEENGKALPAGAWFPSLNEIKHAGAKGCIAEKPDGAKVPVFPLDRKETAAVAAFLKDGLAGVGSPAPTYSARVAFRRFGCLNCHSRDGEGGIPSELADQMRLLEKAENADDVRPPLLTGVGHKARTSWLKSVLTAGGRARPWMQLRMPQYGEANVGFLPEALAQLEGTVPDDAVFKLQTDNAQIALGRQIVGKGGLGCISCHDIGGVANTGTRGPDLATINQRVRYEWYDRWMHQPARMAPGTRMPQAFVDGKSTLTTVLNGDPKGQAEAMWAYLSLGMGLPLPEGLEPPKGLIIAVKDRPELLRTFMPEAGSKAIAVGYPGGVNLAFGADQCRLAYAWAGNFLDAGPVWNNRGGAPAKLLGPKFWAAPQPHPWGLTANPRIPPDFLGRANNPAFGLPLPLEPARIYDGPMAVHFDGYSLDRDSRPTFRYTIDEGGMGAVMKVAETPVPIKTTVATGFKRQFAVEVPAGYRAWFLAGQSIKEPRVIAAAGGRTPALDLKADEPLVIAAGVRVVLPQDGDKVLVLEAVGAPEGSMWRFVPRPGGWLALLRFPEAKDGWKGSFEVALWSLPKDEAALLKDLAAK